MTWFGRTMAKTYDFTVAFKGPHSLASSFRHIRRVSLAFLSDKETGAFSTLRIKKEKKTKRLQHFLDMLTLLWFAKQVPWQPIVRKRLGEPGKAVLFVILGQGFPLGPEPPNTAGGTCFFPQVALLPIWSTEVLFAAGAERRRDPNKILMGGSLQERKGPCWMEKLKRTG